MTHYTSSDTTDGVDLSALYAVNQLLPPIISTSFGLCEAQQGATENQFWSNLWQQAAAEGISVFVSAGDNGAAGCDASDATTATGGLAVSGLASTPFDTAVGGTEFNEVGGDSLYWNNTATNNWTSAKSFIPEIPWNEHGQDSDGGGLWAGSGGISSLYPRPAWQSAPGMQAGGFRLLPDISLSAAAHDGYVVCLEGSCLGGPDNFEFYVFGGTSASSPAMAGVMALVDQSAGSPQGFANPVLYRLAANPSDYSTVFHDVTVGNNNVPCATGSQGCVNGLLGYAAQSGYDLATGLGSLNVANLISSWSSITFAPSQVALTLTLPANPTYGDEVPVAIAVTGAIPDGPVPTGAVELMIKASDGTLTPLATFTLDHSGNVTTSTTALQGGTYSVFARYSGDAVYGPQNSAPVAVSIAKQSVTVTLTILPSGSTTPVSSVMYGPKLQLSATISNATGKPGLNGTVTFHYALATQPELPVSSPVAVVAGSALWSGVFLGPPGAYAMSAYFDGGANYNNATSAPVNLQVNPSPTTTTILSDQDGQLQILIATQSTGREPGGVLALYEGSTYLEGVGLDEVNANTSPGSVEQTLGLPYLPGTTAAITAKFDPIGPGFLPSQSDPFTVVTPANLVGTPSKLSFGPTAYGQTSTVQTATITNEGGETGSTYGPPHTTSTFFSVTSTTCGATLASLASCTIDVVFTPAAPPYQAAASGQVGALVLWNANVELDGNVIGFAPTVPGAGSALVSPGQSATFPLQVTPYGGFTGPVQLSCSNLPALTACSFNPDTVQLDGTHVANSVLTITTTAPPTAGTGATGSFGSSSWEALGLALVLISCALIWRDKPRLRRATLGMFGSAGALLIMAACGGGGGGLPAPPPIGPVVPSPTASVAPLHVNFGAVGIGTTSSPHTLTLTSTGTVAVSFSGVTITGPNKADFSASQSCPNSLAPQNTCPISVTMTPSLPAAEAATLTVGDNATGTQAVSLSGTGVSGTPSGGYSIAINATSGDQKQTTVVGLNIN